MKLPSTLLPPAELIARAKILRIRYETHMGIKSLIIPCHTDKRDFKTTIYADVWRRNGDLL